MYKQKVELQQSTEKIQLLQQDLDEFQKNPVVVQEELDMLAKEMKVLRKRVELANLYHFQMEDFNNLKMEHDFMKVELLIYQKRSKRNEAEQWELYKEQIGEIIQEAFESYWKDEELHQLHIEIY